MVFWHRPIASIIILNKIETINFLLHSSNSKKDQWKDEHDHKYFQQNKFKWYCANIVCASVVNYVSYCLCDFSIHPQSWRKKESIFYENIKIRKTAIPGSRDPAHKYTIRASSFVIKIWSFKINFRRKIHRNISKLAIQFALKFILLFWNEIW